MACEKSVQKIGGRYKYWSISEARKAAVGSKVNVYGVVRYFKEQKGCEAGGFTQVVSLVDESCDVDDFNDKLKCLLYCHNKYTLPQIKSLGDIVRLHRLKLCAHNGEAQAQTAFGFSAVRFDAKNVFTREDISCESAAENITWHMSDFKRLIQLQTFSRSLDFHALECITPKLTFADVDVSSGGGLFFDVSCEVIDKCQLVDESVVLRVWDATKKMKSKKFEFPEETLDPYSEVTKGRVPAELVYYVQVFGEHVKKALEMQPPLYVILKNVHATSVRENDEVFLCLSLRAGGENYQRGICQIALQDRLQERMEQAVLQLETDRQDTQNANQNLNSEQRRNVKNRNNFPIPTEILPAAASTSVETQRMQTTLFRGYQTAKVLDCPETAGLHYSTLPEILGSLPKRHDRRTLYMLGGVWCAEMCPDPREGFSVLDLFNTFCGVCEQAVPRKNRRCDQCSISMPRAYLRRQFHITLTIADKHNQRIHVQLSGRNAEVFFKGVTADQALGSEENFLSVCNILKLLQFGTFQCCLERRGNVFDVVHTMTTH